MKIKFFTFSIIFLGLLGALKAQEMAKVKGVVKNQDQKPVSEVVVYVPSLDLLVTTNAKGVFTLQLPKNESYLITFRSLNIDPIDTNVSVKNDMNLSVMVKEIRNILGPVVINYQSDAFGVRQLHSIEDGGLYEGKKTEVINIEKQVGNKAANNARQAYGKIPSLNIWESDNAGLQLDIGGRGLSPKRTTNFNTRQNGYDISADALGYPESYYTPPLQAVHQVEVVRGAGALQYGSQFGGLINFKMRHGNRKKPFNVESQNTYGAYNFFNTFNSIHGQVKKLNHYSYIQYKRGDGWRPNSEFQQYGAFTGLSYQVSDRLKLRFDYTFMYYMSQQAGGLTDEMFEVDPQQSNRERNWFRVNWNLAAFSVEYYVTPKVKMYNRTFGLLARRTSLGLLETPNVEDPNSLRDLIDGQFKNIGNETRLVIPYLGIDSLNNTLLVGTRLYRGFTNFSQGFGSDGRGADFTKLDTNIVNRRVSDFDFPNFNAALFAESIVRLSNSLSLIPGIRYEFINTKSRGFFKTAVPINSFGDFIEQTNFDTSANQRSIFLYGLGLSKKFNDKYELYANATRNYRAINFTDVQIQTNTQLVDSLIKDESGYSFDIGVRRMNFSPFFVEVGFFYLLYADRIGEIIDDGLRVRTNVGSSRIYGMELYFEVNVLKALKKESKHKISVFVNGFCQ